MDSGTLIAAIIQGLVGCAIVYFVLNFLRQKKNNSANDEIKNIEAKMSNMRLILKAKVKKKSNFFRSTSPVPIKQGDPFDVASSELAELAFEKNEDFEKYFVLSKQLNTYIKLTLLKSQPAADAAPPSEAVFVDLKPNPDADRMKKNPEFMTTDIKNEFTIIKIIHEMITVSKALKKKIEDYNLTHPKLPITPPEVIQFASITEVKRIFSGENSAVINSEKTAA